MATIAIVGGAGQIARLVHPKLIHSGHQPRALVRRQEQADELEQAGVDTRLFDLENDDDEALRAALEGADAVIFAAGGGPDGNADRKRTVDLEGSIRSAQAAEALGIARFVQVSAIGVDEPLGDDVEPVWRVYVEAKRDADDHLRKTSLSWTILRPGKLTDDEGTGHVALGADVARGEVTRDDVAAAIAAVVDDGRSVRQQWDLVGGTTPILEAVGEATAGQPL
ncbi:SDR family oxidoreductase [Aeromicrobium alkaliterrae]|uniref:NAD(P)H-binding protein n=1 Tax=Aeromicrobium alkaliterrae TaxID=302168 RepID=A0ABN2JW17_9ACTN